MQVPIIGPPVSQGVTIVDSLVGQGIRFLKDILGGILGIFAG